MRPSEEERIRTVEERMIRENKRLMNKGNMQEYRNNCNILKGIAIAKKIYEGRLIKNG